MQAVSAGCSRKGRQRVQNVPECAGSWFRLFKSVLAVGAGCSRVCRQWVQVVSRLRRPCVQAVPECTGS